MDAHTRDCIFNVFICLKGQTHTLVAYNMSTSMTL
jgi:hypothetical protein